MMVVLSFAGAQHAVHAWRRYLPNRLSMAAALLTITVVAMATTVSWLGVRDPADQDLRARLRPPSRHAWFGTDAYGRDILSRVFWGSRLSLTVGVVSVVLGAAVGFAMGVGGGYYGGAVDGVVTRVTDTLLVFPGMVVALVLMAMLGASVKNVIVAISVTLIPTFSRVTRSAVVTVRRLEYVEAARAVGASDRHIVRRHIAPNSLSPALVLASLNVARAILIESNLSFLGVGVPPTTATWGLMVSEGLHHLRNAPWVPLIPGAVIMLTVLAINVVGDAVRDALDPRLRGQQIGP